MPKILDTENAAQKSGLWWLWISALVLLLDQWSKIIATQSLKIYDAVVVNEYLNWTLMHNEGMAFSFLADQSGWQRWGISIVAIVIVVWLLFWLKKNPFKNTFLNLGLTLVIGGALGNIYDRINLGYVIDFIEVHYQQHFWPAFNLADSAISLGAFFLILDLIWGKHEDKPGKS
ncbi:MAG TPA: lipoprotein signal peptidase [Oceanospirillales bacterium]|nr:lipoprotein signal peptidase [Oceanospirillales bacterium]